MDEKTAAPQSPARDGAGDIGAAGQAALFARLDSLGIAHETVSHPPLFTVEQSRALRGSLPGAHIKNLFLLARRGKRERSLWLLTCLENRSVHLKSLGEALGAGRLSFAPHETLAEALAVAPGAVTPLAALNDAEGRVRVVLDSGLAESVEVNVHPLVNRQTTRLATADLVRFLIATSHPPLWYDFAGNLLRENAPL